MLVHSSGSSVSLPSRPSVVTLRAQATQHSLTASHPPLPLLILPSFPVPISMSVQGETGLESYRDDPTMTSTQYDPRSPPLNSPPVRDLAAAPARPPLLSIRSS